MKSDSISVIGVTWNDGRNALFTTCPFEHLIPPCVYRDHLLGHASFERRQNSECQPGCSGKTPLYPSLNCHRLNRQQFLSGLLTMGKAATIPFLTV